MKFQNSDVYGFAHAIRGMRAPKQSYAMSDSNTHYADGFQLGPADKHLALALVVAGAEHAKFLRQIQVWVDITAPRFWWQEYDQYHYHVSDSESTMHTIHKRYLTQNDFDGGIDMADLAILNGLIVKLRSDITDVDALLKIKRKLPESFLQLRTINTNYAELRNIYFQRKNHRLPHWQEFCKWIDSLPYSDLITVKKA